MNCNVYSFALEGLEACRVCLATDIKLYGLHESGLSQTYFEFTGTPISSVDGLPQQICVFCCTMLKKSFEFRNKCRSAHSILMQHLMEIHCLTTSYIKSINTFNFRLPLEISKTEITDVEQEIEQHKVPENFKKEVPFDFEQENDPIDDNTVNDFENFFFDDPCVKSEDDCVFMLKDTNKIKKEKRKDKSKESKTKVTENEKEVIKEFKVKYIDNTVASEKKIFYEYILEKYIKKKGKIETNIKFNPLDSIDKKSNNVKSDISTTKSSDTIDKMATQTHSDSTENLNQQKLHQYISEKYKQNNPSAEPGKKVTDVTRMRETKNKKTNHRSRTIDELASFSKTYDVEVVILNKDEQIADVKSRKETDKYKKAKFKCEDCCRGFTLEKAFQNHMAIHDLSTGPHSCDICGVRFPKRNRLTKHIQLRHKYKFICRLCRQVTRNSTCAREHFKCHAGFQYECDHCGKMFSKYGSRINHIRIFHGSAKCDVCQQTFAGTTGLLAHKTKAHRELFKCTICGVQFHNADALKKHRELLLGVICGPHVRPCTQCGDNFASDESVKEHMQQNHNKQKPGRKSQSNPTLTLSNPTPRVRWVARRPPRRPRDPPTTPPRGTTRKGDRLMCEMCGADGFASEAVLRYHQRIHTGEKPHPCPNCPKRFRIRELLQKHIRTHTGDRPYACAHCPKAFKTTSAHYTHQVVHTKVRRHRCHICEKTFLTSTCVRTHIKSVHMKIPVHRHNMRESVEEQYLANMAGYMPNEN